MLYGIVIIAGIVIAGLGYVGMRYVQAARLKPAAAAAEAPTAPILLSASGKVMTLKSGSEEWREVKTGASLAEGDLIRTDNTGSLTLQYPDGTMVSVPEQTTLIVQTTGSGPMEIVMPETPLNKAPGGDLQAAQPGVDETDGIKDGKAGRPSIALQRIIPFGRSLELIGVVDAGSTLTVNDERVEVEGDGLFKHFTKLFPADVDKVQLVLKVTDLAGRTSVMTATYDFSPHRDR